MGEQYDAANQQVVRPDGSAPWEVGSGGSVPVEGSPARAEAQEQEGQAQAEPEPEPEPEQGTQQKRPVAKPSRSGGRSEGR